MAQFSAQDVQALRKSTGAGMMDAKKALEATDGDQDKAADYLREKGIAKAAKRADREQGQGVVGVYMHTQAGRPVIGVLIGLASETDFVAKSPDFIAAANDIAMHAAAAKPLWLRREDVPEVDVAKEMELIAAEARNEGKPDNIIEKIVDGRINSFYKDNVLLDQVFVRSDRFEGTVGEMVQELAVRMGENISLSKMAIVEIGAG
ncbi:MAG: translation elongation factor Ts [Actinomycetia bacterium]|jgi:elongation factor Ts|nr:translation elongation factor Ts [Actinomycetes bacterium]